MTSPETVQALRVAAAIEAATMSDRIFVKGLALSRLSRRDAARSQSGANLIHDLTSRSTFAAAARSDKVVDTVSYDKVVDCVSKAFCAQRLSPD